MAKKAEVSVLDVLYTNEARHQDMLDIMKHLQSYLGKDFTNTVPSGGDLLTCERQRCAKLRLSVNEGGGELYYCKWCSAG